MYYREGERWQGRFIKTGSALMKNVTVQEFALEEISENFMLLADNAEGNIIHMSSHEEIAHESGVKDSIEIDQDLATTEMKRPVLRPLDFTEEWRRQRKSRNRRAMNEDDDNQELINEVFNSQTNEFEPADKPIDSDDRALANSAKANAMLAQEDQEKAEPEKPVQAFRIQKQNLSDAKDFIQSAHIEAETNTTRLEKVSGVSTPPPTAPNPPPPVAEKVPEFVPFSAAAKEEQNLEAEAIGKYRMNLKDRKEQEEEEARLLAESKAKGYEDGFAEGETKAAMQMLENNKNLVEQLSAIVDRFESMKKDILHNAQENFQVVCQTLIESLLRREFSINPDAFASIIDRAVDETIANDNFKIRLHPKNFHAMESIAPDHLKKKIIIDESVKEGDFRIETNLSVVDGNVGQLIRDLLEQADLQLFDSSKKAS